jgi:hypothetical protein
VLTLRKNHAVRRKVTAKRRNHAAKEIIAVKVAVKNANKPGLPDSFAANRFSIVPTVCGYFFA